MHIAVSISSDQHQHLPHRSRASISPRIKTCCFLFLGGRNALLVGRDSTSCPLPRVKAIHHIHSPLACPLQSTNWRAVNLQARVRSRGCVDATPKWIFLPGLDGPNLIPSETDRRLRQTRKRCAPRWRALCVPATKGAVSTTLQVHRGKGSACNQSALLFDPAKGNGL